MLKAPAESSWLPRPGPAWPYLQALAIFLVSRLVVGLAVVFGGIFVPLGDDTFRAGENWYYRLLRWDSEWYHIIATQGYVFDGDVAVRQTVAFYPLFPLLARGVAGLTGLDVADAMLLVANAAALAAILLLFRLVRGEYGDPVALLAIALISFFPASVFLSAGYTEPLVLLWMVGFFLALARQRFVWAAVLAGLAVGTRSSGIVLLPVLWWELWRHRGIAQFFRDIVPLTLLATSGLWLYMIYLGHAFGRPLAFSEAQMAFHGGTTMATRLVAALTLQPFLKLDLADLRPSGLDQWFVLIALLLIVRVWFRMSTAMAMFATGVLLLPYLTLSGGPAGLTSMARFNVVSFPLFVAAAELGARAQWLATALVGLLGGLLFMHAALFSQWQWAG